MHRRKNLSRVLSMVLAFCLSVALLPVQAFAVTKDDDPTTWPAPDSIYTAPDKNPVYLMVDFTDEDNGGIAASHYCVSGAALTPEIVKATASASGYVKYICDNCGSWAQGDIPHPTGLMCCQGIRTLPGILVPFVRNRTINQPYDIVC